MLETKLNRTGSILFHDGKIQIEGFSDECCMCREVTIHAMLWAIGELQREIMHTIAAPGGSGNVSLDFPSDLRGVLGMPNPWDYEEDEETA